MSENMSKTLEFMDRIGAHALAEKFYQVFSPEILNLFYLSQLILLIGIHITSKVAKTQFKKKNAYYNTFFILSTLVYLAIQNGFFLIDFSIGRIFVFIFGARQASIYLQRPIRLPLIRKMTMISVWGIAMIGLFGLLIPLIASTEEAQVRLFSFYVAGDSFVYGLAAAIVTTYLIALVISIRKSRAYLRTHKKSPRKPQKTKPNDRKILNALGHLSKLITKLPETILKGLNLEKKLPVETLLKLKTRQQNSEIFISFLQLIAILCFLFFYSSIPTDDLSDNASYNILQLCFAIYIIFLVFRLFYSLTEDIGWKFLAFSIFVDVGILMGAIWSLHIIYDAPASVYLKSPLYFYSFVLIALRTLRFQPAWVIYTGLLCAAGWAVLSYIASQETQAYTDSYVSYLVSDSFSVTAELDKIMALVMSTLFLALSQGFAQRSIIESARTEHSIKNLSRFFDSSVLTKILDQEEGLRAERRRASIMMVDMRGFTKLTQSHNPRLMVELLRDYQNFVAEIIRTYNGSIDKFIGDGILVSFGAPQPASYHAYDCLQAGKKILDRHKTWQSERKQKALPAPSIGVGIATGDVIFGIMGDENHFECTVLGNAVNKAAKLESATKDFRCRLLSDEMTYSIARQQGLDFEMSAQKTANVKGISSPVDLRRLS